ncbi:MAG: MBL fold metallo-hydrolase [Hahellaceae bacterium]|nr:MBL fold metallo-hydrolase [Hahellaceae bacterium]MCP5211293.1 MBL fold metallo-hydrolase [Hahellaceae bacterium]
MQIKHHGAVKGVTGSCHELSYQSDKSILVDCGLFQGAETSPGGAESNNLGIDFPVGHLQALVVTHVHIDHVGRIPHLIAAGFRGPVICSEPSAKLLPLVLEDAMKIGVTDNQQLTENFLKLIRQRIIALPYKKWHRVDDHLSIRLSPAGHILGSAYVECDVVADQVVEAGRGVTKKPVKHRVVFSGDLGAPYAPLLPAPKSPYGCDTLVIESTYGDRLHESRKSRKERLEKVLVDAVRDRGVILIPAFSIGRTQEILYELEGLIAKNAGKKLTHDLPWSDLQVVVDSPLAAKFTEHYKSLQKYWDAEALNVISKGRHPLSFEQLLTVDGHADHIQVVNYLKQTARPVIVIAASGMCNGGRIQNYLKALLEDKRTDVVFIGYQAKGTVGAQIQSGGGRDGRVRIDGESYRLNARVHQLSGYSAHADQKDLLSFIGRMRKKPKDVRIVHGDERAKNSLKSKISQLLPGANVRVPRA